MYTIRPARPADLDRLVELLQALQDHLEAANPDLWRMTGEGRAQLRSQIANRLRADDTCALVAEHDTDGVIGVAFGRVVTNSRYTPARVGQVDQIFVRAEHRRMGVASRLVAGLCRFFAGQGVEDLSLRYVVGNEEAAGFWSSLGFAARIIVVGADRRAIEARLEPPEPAVAL